MRTSRTWPFATYHAASPMVLVLSRGGFCPKDRRQAEGLLELHPEMEVGYCRLVTISTEVKVLQAMSPAKPATDPDSGIFTASMT